jgi:hypothetical protein
MGEWEKGGLSHYQAAGRHYQTEGRYYQGAARYFVYSFWVPYQTGSHASGCMVESSLVVFGSILRGWAWYERTYG